jgi:hypothetical protein
VNAFRLAKQCDREIPRLLREENGNLIHTTKTSRGGTYFVVSSLGLREVRPKKTVLPAVIPRLLPHPSALEINSR